MSRLPRWLPEPKTLVEVTTRTFQGRYLLKPTPEIREIVLGVVGRAQRMHDMKICMLTFMSNHYHLLLVPRHSEQLARFMGFVNGEIAREINRLGHWDGKVWARRYDAIVVSNEPRAQIARFRYLLGHGVKEGLVERPEQWIGAHGVGFWLYGQALRGYWFDRSRETRARRRGKTPDRLAFATEESVRLSPLPCWQAEGASEESIRARVREMVEHIVVLGEIERRHSRSPLADLEQLLALPWDFRPKAPARSPKPLIHAYARAVRNSLAASLGEFLEVYRRASERLRSGERDVRFPDGCFPPAGPFVGFRGLEGRGGAPRLSIES